MTVNIERERKALEIFDHILLLPDSEREAYLVQACGNDDLLRHKVNKLLIADREADNRLEQALNAQIAKRFLVTAPNKRTIIPICKLIASSNSKSLFKLLFKLSCLLLLVCTITAIILRENAYFKLPASGRNLNYSLALANDPTRLLDPDRVDFQTGDEIWLNLRSPQPGFLYIINEAPLPDEHGLPIYTLLFPIVSHNNGSSALVAHQEIKNSLQFDRDNGMEKIWLIWSASKINMLEEVNNIVQTQNNPLITNSEQIRYIKQFLAHYAITNINKNKTVTAISVGTKENILVNCVKLAHR